MSRARWLICGLGVGVLFAITVYHSSGIRAFETVAAAEPSAKEATDARATGPGWVKGKGYGWIWGKDDELGALNTMTDATRLAALKIVKKGQTYDLGVKYSQNSFKWPGHSPASIITYRTPEGVKRQGDHPFVRPDVNPAGQGWHSCALFINDNVGTQIDGLGHVTVGDDNHWYNGFKEADWGGNFGVRKCSAADIPPIVARGVLLDVAAARGTKALPPHYAITPEDVEMTCKKQGTELRQGDVVLFRTGVLQFWGEDGADVNVLKEYDTAGITLETAKYMIEQKGSLMLGADTSGLEVAPAPAGSDTFIPVHKYLLIEQGVHILEFHNLEKLSRDQVYEFCYCASTNKVMGTAAGFTLKPFAMR